MPGAIGALLLLVVSLVCGWAMFAVSGMENYEPLLKTVRYSLNWEMGMGFYDKPGGTEQMVMYPEDGADPSLVPEKKEGERWLDTGKLKVDKPSDGWAKVDIGDDGEPLYVEEQYVISKEGAMFEGRQGENTFLTVGAKNLPPSGWIKLLGFLVYFSLYFPLFAIFRWGFDTEEHTRRVMKHVSWIVYAGLAYFIILYTLKFVCGYNVDRYWFVSATVLGNTFYSIANMVLGIIGCLAMVFVHELRCFHSLRTFAECRLERFLPADIRGLFPLDVLGGGNYACFDYSDCLFDNNYRAGSNGRYCGKWWKQEQVRCSTLQLLCFVRPL